MVLLKRLYSLFLSLNIIFQMGGTIHSSSSGDLPIDHIMILRIRRFNLRFKYGEGCYSKALFFVLEYHGMFVVLSPGTTPRRSLCRTGDKIFRACLIGNQCQYRSCVLYLMLHRLSIKIILAVFYSQATCSASSLF